MHEMPDRDIQPLVRKLFFFSLHPLSSRDVQPFDRKLGLHPLSGGDVQPFDRKLFFILLHLMYFWNLQ